MAGMYTVFKRHHQLHRIKDRSSAWSETVNHTANTFGVHSAILITQNSMF